MVHIYRWRPYHPIGRMAGNTDSHPRTLPVEVAADVYPLLLLMERSAALAKCQHKFSPEFDLSIAANTYSHHITIFLHHLGWLPCSQNYITKGGSIRMISGTKAEDTQSKSPFKKKNVFTRQSLVLKMQIRSQRYISKKKRKGNNCQHELISLPSLFLLRDLLQR